MDSENKQFEKYTSRSRLDKSINSLIGLIEGITIDGLINSKEEGLLRAWLEEHREYEDMHPFNELVPVVDKAIADGIIDDEEREDIHWLCEKLLSTEFFNETTSGLQVLHGILGGIASDGKVTKDELRGLSEWLSDHDHLRTCYPYDEVDSLITSILADGVIDEEEHKILQQFFSEFLAVFDDRTITAPLMTNGGKVEGVCAACPEITFKGSSFCFTGESNHYSRTDFINLVSSLGGKAVNSVSQKLNYLVIGAEGNKCWTYSCYGRKVERAVELRKQGSRLLIVHENDFNDAVADA